MTHNLVSASNRRNARTMRKVTTDAELKLWNEIRAHRLMGLGFRRQMPIAGYIVDFACPEKS
jgi:very-short-patch-repair endonuclease